MKNIHILPTDKETRLYLSNYGKELNLASHPKTLYTTGQHIYITSDEEIKEEDWFITKGEVFKCTLVTEFIWRNNFDKFPSMKIDYKKIILTTDQDLIKDGVQAIDDEFLEWFVKNPSCERVDIVNKGRIGIFSDGTSGIVYNKYKIIIPKEKETKCYCGHTKTCDCGPETLEEAMERLSNIVGVGGISDKHAFMLGTFWQQERSYSEKELLASYADWSINGDCTYYEWFEQFKKK